ncbi:MAG: hypothetical protein ACKVOK_09380 [Flavobacteriales bacterium]
MRYHPRNKSKNSILVCFPNFAVISFLLLFICSCEDPIKIIVVGDESLISKNIVFDEEDTLILSGVLDTVLLRPTQLHSVSIDGAVSQKFNFDHNGGILNLANREFVAFTIEYQQENPKHPNYTFQLELRNCVIIDSNLVYNISNDLTPITEDSIKSIIDSIALKKYGNYRPEVVEYRQNKKFSRGFDFQNYDTSTGVTVFKKFGKGELFIKKFWNYGLDEEIPETIQIKVRGEQPFFNTSQSKVCIVTDEAFLILARLKPDEYNVIDIRELLRNKK